MPHSSNSIFHTLDPDPSVNSLDPEFCTQEDCSVMGLFGPEP